MPAIRGGCPDFWRIKEWKREFAEFVAKGAAPNLMLVALSNDHFGAYDKAIDGVNTPETQMADNDYALGQLIETVADSPFAKDTLIVSIEDDACDGPDHVDAHRSIALFAGPYIRQHAVVSTRYTTVSVVKTIEEILGIGSIGLNDALAVPMSDVFDPNQVSWSYKAIVPDVLRSTKLPLPPVDHASIELPTHSAAYWTRAMAGQDFSGPDRIEPVSFNRTLWRGLMSDTPYPAAARPGDAGQGGNIIRCSGNPDPSPLHAKIIPLKVGREEAKLGRQRPFAAPARGRPLATSGCDHDGACLRLAAGARGVARG